MNRIEVPWECFLSDGVKPRDGREEALPPHWLVPYLETLYTEYCLLILSYGKTMLLMRSAYVRWNHTKIAIIVRNDSYFTENWKCPRGVVLYIIVTRQKYVFQKENRLTRNTRYRGTLMGATQYDRRWTLNVASCDVMKAVSIRNSIVENIIIIIFK